MPYGAITLVPGVNVENTPTTNKAGLNQGQLIRVRDTLTQKYGGWQKFYAFSVAGTPRDLHAWQDLNGSQHLLAGTTSSLNVITGPSLANITPQQFSTNNLPNFSTVANSTTVTIIDSSINNVTVLDTIMVNTPVTIGTAVISGIFPIVSTLGGTGYTINLPTPAGATINNAGALPLFTLGTSLSLVNVNFTSHGIASSIVGPTVVFQATTTIQNVVIYGSYPVTFIDANNFRISVAAQATSAATSFMNAGNANLQYFIALGPAAAGAGYGTGTYGSGGYGTGQTGSSQTGNPITATDWNSDNWGQIALTNPTGGAVYQYDPTSGFTNAALVNTAPPFNTGLFVSNTLQILFLYGSTANATIGQSLDPMLVRWSDVGDYTQFRTLTTNQAGSFRIPIGSVIRGGSAMANQNLFWTDLDLWSANYAGYPLVFGFTKIGSGAGLISSHAEQVFRGGVYWMGPSNFYSYVGGAVQVIPCPVWDFVFQNMNTSFTHNVRAMPNTPFNEVGWLFPSAASVSGECDSYVKMNVTEPGRPWDYGTLSRSAWLDQTVLGNPIGASSNGIIYQHEMTNDADGQPLMSSFTTSYAYIDEGQEYATIDFVIPDFIYGTYAGSKNAQIQISFNVVNYPGDTPNTYGPYTVTSTTEFIPVRFRGRQMSITVASSDLGSFWRLGKVRYQYKKTGRL